MVLHLDRDADRFQLAHHLGTQVLELVHRRYREVALLVPRLVREVRRAVELALASRVPHALDRVEEVVTRELVLIEAHRVEDVELGFRPEVRGVGEAGRLQVRLGLLHDVARVARVRLARERIAHVRVDVQRGVLAERIEHRGVRIGDQEHVRLLDLLEAADRRAVEAEAVLEHVLGELVRRHREVLHQTRKVAEPHVDDLDVAVLDELQDVARGALLHVCSLLLLLSERAAHRVGDEARHDVRIHVGVGTTVFDVALAVDLDLPRDAHRRTAVGDAVVELVPRRGLVQTGEPALDAVAVVLDVLDRLLPERLARGDDRLVRRAHRLRGEVRVRARAVPVAGDRLRVERRRDAELLGDAVEEPTRHPQLVGDVERAQRADLELPLTGHHLGVDAGDREPGFETRVEVLLDDVAAEHLVGADTAVVEALRRGEAALGEAVRAPALEERVLLLDAEQRLLAGELLGDRREQRRACWSGAASCR